MGKIYNNVTSVISNILFDLLFIFLQYDVMIFLWSFFWTNKSTWVGCCNIWSKYWWKIILKLISFKMLTALEFNELILFSSLSVSFLQLLCCSVCLLSYWCLELKRFINMLIKKKWEWEVRMQWMKGGTEANIFMEQPRSIVPPLVLLTLTTALC